MRSGETLVLVDAGVSRLQILKRLAVFGISIDDLDAVFITHEHSDHIMGLDVLARRHPVPVWATRGTWSRLDVRCDGGGDLESGCEVVVGNISVLPVGTSHDAAEPVAFVIDDGNHQLGYCTDTGIFTGLLERRMGGVDLLLIETNHDADMLRHGPYPWPLKQRIASRLGHLANHQTQEAVDRMASPNLCGAVGLHLSEENNAAALALEALKQSLPEDVPSTVVTRSEMLRITIESGAAIFEKHELPAKGS
ncbi:MAG: MBL fold metallo-hydrolase [Thermoanaerobaculales bacterium]|nr:MBL fold metallo-hydrolase [Thermoanaerobaculales bacterium]